MAENVNDFNYYFEEDLKKLFNVYSNYNFFKYNDFLEIWNVMKFNQIFLLAKFYPFEYSEFMKDSLKITTQFLHDDQYNFEVRAAALYTLYALFTNLNQKPRFKIPVTCEQWSKIIEFIHIMSSQRTEKDIEFIFRYLLHSKAFEFCTDQELKQSNMYNLKTNKDLKKSKPNADSQRNQADLEKFVAETFEDELIDQMGLYHEAYLQLKEDLANENPEVKLNNYIIPNFQDLKDAQNFIENKNQTIKSDKKVVMMEKIRGENNYKLDYAFQNLSTTSKAKKPMKKKSKSVSRINRNLDNIMNYEDNNTKRSKKQLELDEQEQEQVQNEVKEGNDDEDDDDDDNKAVVEKKHDDKVSDDGEEQEKEPNKEEDSDDEAPSILMSSSNDEEMDDDDEEEDDELFNYLNITRSTTAKEKKDLF